MADTDTLFGLAGISGNDIHSTTATTLSLEEAHSHRTPAKMLSRFNEGRFDLIIGDHVIKIMEIVVITILCGLVSATGMVANVINILIFCRQGMLSSSSNVSLIALAVADTGCLITVLCNSINYAIFYVNKDVMPFLTPQDFTEIFILWPHIMFVQISSWVTVFIAFERCLCVVFPLKVKLIFSAKRSLVVVGMIFTLITMSFIPIYVTTYTEERQDLERNVTKLIHSLSENQFEIVDVSNIVQSIVLRILSVSTVFICTQITVYRVRMSTTWRKSLAVNNHSGSRKSDVKMERNKFKNHPSTSAMIAETLAYNKDENSVERAPCGNGSGSVNVNTKHIGSVVTEPKSHAKNDAPTSAPAGTTTSIKEQRLIRIITVISTIFMVCNTPEIVGIFTLIAMESLHGISPWDNLIHFIMYFQFLSESINASINILVYYKMSTRYKLEFRALFGLDK